MTRLVPSLFTILIVSSGLPDFVHAADPFDAFLEKHCIRCHGPEKEKGDLRIDQLSRDFKLGADTHHWAEMIEQVNSGEMPPKKEKKPTQEEIAVFVTSLDAHIKEGRAARMAARPAVALYRLSRKEYQNTVYDLLGVRYDPAKPGELNEDTLWHGFERIGSELSLSPSHVDRYYRAAELVLDRAFSTAVTRPRPTSATTAARSSRRRWTASASSARCVTCCFLATLKMHSRPIGSARSGRSTAGSTSCESRPAASARSAARQRI
jgi:hypothetical protein